MEDCKVNYDMTVRNAGGGIIQYLYGEDGMDACKIDTQHLAYVTKNHDEIKAMYGLVDGKKDFKQFVSAEIYKTLDASFEKRMEAHLQQIHEDREHFIVKMNKGKKETSVAYPVALDRILTNIQNTYQKFGANVPHDLSPIYVLDKLDELSKELVVTKQYPGTKLFNILLRAYLTPKNVIVKHCLTKTAFDAAIDMIKFRFFEALVHPSEMVGVIAAQSIGEPATQLSTLKDAKIRVFKKDRLTQLGEYYNTTMGEFIDMLHRLYENDIIDLGKGSTVIDLKDDYYVIGVSNNEKTSWKRISQVSRHYANGGIVKVYTRSGKYTGATLSHSFLKRSESSIVPVLGSDLKIGDRIPVAKFIPEIESPVYTREVGAFDEVLLDNDFGWLCGAYLADGDISGYTTRISKIDLDYRSNVARIFKDVFGLSVTEVQKEGCIKNVGNGKYKDRVYVGCDMYINNGDVANFMKSNFGSGSYKKRLPGWVFGSNIEFIKGIIQGYFDGDGNVADGRGKGMIRAHSVCEGFIDDMIVLLAYVGIFASKTFETKSDPECPSLHTIQISRKYAQYWKDALGFVIQSKAKSLDEVIAYQARDDKNTNQEYIDKIPELGKIISEVGFRLCLPGQSRNYGRWEKKESIGRETLIKYIDIFEKANAEAKIDSVSKNIEILKQAAFSDVVWDEIVDLKYEDDPKEFVYDFTVPGNDSFMVDTCVLVHNTLNTFHSAGNSSASKGVRGVPRLNELLAVSKKIKTPVMNIYLPKDVSSNKLQALELMNNIRTINFKDIITTSKIYFDPDDFNSNIIEDRGFMESYKAFTNEANSIPWLLRMECDCEKLLNFGLDMITLRHALYNFYNDKISVMFSDDNAKKLVLRIRINRDEDETQSDDILTDLKALEHNIIENVPIKGVKSINRVALEERNNGQLYNPLIKAFEDSKEWVVYTEGSNLRDVLALSFIDATRSISNDVNEVYDVLGVEAARQALYNEIIEVLDSAGHVNYRHVALLVDVMTNRGNILSVNRFGINRGDIGPLAKCSFEETTDKLLKAGIFAEYDKINGVSANVMLGQIPPCGTGDVGVVMDNVLMSQMAEVSTHKFTMIEDTEHCEPDHLAINMPAIVASTTNIEKTDNDMQFID
jgi:DNA-directed RNA polymerase subunit A"